MKHIMFLGSAIIIGCLLAEFTNILPTDDTNGVETGQDAPYLIPTRMDIQQWLVDEGYEIKVDGSMGPETDKAWDDYEIKTFSERLKGEKP